MNKKVRKERKNERKNKVENVNRYAVREGNVSRERERETLHLTSSHRRLQP